jgi:hypothetical protein
MSRQIAKIFSQTFGTKVTLKSQQTGSKYGKNKIRYKQSSSRKNTKKN